VKPTRRSVLKHALLACAAPALGGVQGAALVRPAAAEEDAWRHGLSLFGDLRYAPGFKHFEYVNPSAPKGGTVRLMGLRTFDNLNSVVALVKGNLAGGINMIYDELLESAGDEVSTMYGLLAESVKHPADFSSVTYRLREGAKWHDGKPVTPEDVIYSFEIGKQHNPQLAAYYRHVTKAERSGERDVVFTFDQPGNRELPLIVGQLTVLPKHYWEGTDSAGRKRDVTATTLEPPLGSGPYRIKEVIPGRSISYERVPDYWARDLNVNVGRNNFDEVRFEYFRDSLVALEAFKADQIDFRTETSAKNWATSYDFPAVQEKRVILEEFPLRSVGVMQAFLLNLRRAKFSDPRVRRALNFVFDFEDMNKQMFFGQYKRITSYFEGIELASSGLPQGLELEILETVRDKVPPEVFTSVYTNPVSGSPEAIRNNLREAIRLMKEAGWEIRDRRLVNVKTNEQMQIELLVNDPTFERVMLYYKPSLERLGIAVSVRQIDEAQYENRLRQWDYDVIVNSWSQSLSPGNEQLGYWGSKAADQPGSYNHAGIKNPAIDDLIQRVIFAKSREELVAATRALDRVLLWNHYVVPQWTYGKTRTARWNRYGRPATLPRYNEPSFSTVWWWDADKAAQTGGRS